jgi:hypothetical protein
MLFESLHAKAIYVSFLGWQIFSECGDFKYEVRIKKRREKFGS